MVRGREVCLNSPGKALFIDNWMPDCLLAYLASSSASVSNCPDSTGVISVSDMPTLCTYPPDDDELGPYPLLLLLLGCWELMPSMTDSSSMSCN